MSRRWRRRWCSVSEMAAALPPGVASVEINPLLVLPAGEGVLMLDVAIELEEGLASVTLTEEQLAIKRMVADFAKNELAEQRLQTRVRRAVPRAPAESSPGRGCSA